MRKNLPLIVLGLVVALVVVAYIGYSSSKKEQAPPVIRDVKVSPAEITGDDTPSDNKVKSEEGKITVSETKEANIPEVNAKSGEMMVWGEVKAIDVDKRILTIDQQMDDNSVKISPNVPVSKDSIIRSKNQILSLAQIKPGDSVGAIVTKEGQARAVLINY